MNIPDQLNHILKAVHNEGGLPYIVGGSVRDLLMGVEPADFDVEVFGLDFNRLSKVLGQFGRIDLVGQSFGIIKLRQGDHEFDFSIPRRENRVGVGHKDFMVATDPNMSVKEACARRDFTMNSMCFDWLNRRIVDPFNGREAFALCELVPTSGAFEEDALRVLRGMQFAGRFSMFASKKMIDAAGRMKPDFAALPKERIWGEWEKWAIKSVVPHMGLALLKECGWIEFFPEIAALVDVPQDAEWHPEGDVFVHTGHVCNAAAVIAQRENLPDGDRLVLMFAALCHDFAKPACTVIGDDGRIRSPGHAEAGGPMAKVFLERIGAPAWLVDRVVPLVVEHMVHVSCQLSPRVARRISLRLSPSSISDLLLVIESDMNGRPPLPHGLPESARELGALADSLAVLDDRPVPLLMGRHLIALGVQPGPEMGAMLKRAFDAQLDGEFDSVEKGLEFLGYDNPVS